MINNCTHIFWQWSFLGVGGLTTPNPRVNGFVLITVDNARTIKPVVEQYVEFNSVSNTATRSEIELIDVVGLG